MVSIIMQQIFQATHDLLDKKFRQVWEESVQIAALSRVLAKNHPHLDNEQAMLAGLIHNIRITSYNVCYTKLLRSSAEFSSSSS